MPEKKQISEDPLENNSPKITGGQRSIIFRILKWFPAVTLILLGCLIFFMHDQIRTRGDKVAFEITEQKGAEQIPANVVVMEMKHTTLKERLSLPGTVKPWMGLEVVAEVSGKVVEKKAAEGQHLKRGDVIAMVDERDYKNALVSAQASFELAVSTRKRLEKLYRKKIATQSQIDDVMATVKRARAARDNALLALERCSVRAPFEGVVNRFFIEPGQYLAVGDKVAQVLQLDRVKVNVGIPESDVDKVRKIEHFTVSIDALKGRVFDARRHYLYKNSDSFARLYMLEVAVDNPDGEILPDMFTQVEIVKTEVKKGLGVPMYALISRDEKNHVFVVEDGAVRFKEVETGIQDGWMVEISKGLKPGDRVVVVGQRQIDDGDRVNITKTVLSTGELSP